MVRPKGKPQKIAFKLIGKPQNLVPQEKSEKQKRINRILLFQETTRVR